MIFGLGVAAAVCSALATFFVRARTRRIGMLDIPNARSSHVIPTPRGGGLGFVVVVSGFTAALYAAHVVDPQPAVAILCGAVLLGGIGWIDDRASVQPGIRLLVQLAAAVIVVAALGGLPRIGAFGTSVELGWLGWPVAVFGIVWLTNIFNFMDGVDGIAGSQGAIAFAFAAIALAHGHVTGITSISAIFSGALIGFLVWNWPPASIFMGDVGSGFIGFVLGVVAIASEPGGRLGVFGVLAVCSPFIVDATITILLRITRGERAWQPHRQHIYQRVARHAASHSASTSGYAIAAILAGLLTVLWLRQHADGALPLVLCVVVLCSIYGVAHRFLDRN